MKAIRNFARYAMGGKIILKLLSDTSKSIEGKLCEIGSGGCGIILKEHVDKDTLVQFELVNRFLVRDLTGKGRISYSRQEKSGRGEFAVGIEFIGVDKEIILALISENQRIERQEKTKDLQQAKQRQVGSQDLGAF